MSHGRFATALNCIDGRTQQAVFAWVRRTAGVDFVDMVTEPGPDKALLAGGALVAALKSKVAVSVEKHGSAFVAIAGHHECAANPVSREQHVADLERAVEVVRDWGVPVTVVGLYVNDAWQVEEVVPAVESATVSA